MSNMTTVQATLSSFISEFGLDLNEFFKVSLESNEIRMIASSNNKVVGQTLLARISNKLLGAEYKYDPRYNWVEVVTKHEDLKVTIIVALY